MYPHDSIPPPSRQHAPVREVRSGPSPVTTALAVLLLLVTAALLYAVLRGQRPAPGAAAPVADATAAAGSGQVPLVAAPSAGAAPPRAITARGDLAADEQATIELFQQTSPSVVHVTSLIARRNGYSMNVFEIPQGTGSGFLWDARGHVVTNFHVVAPQSRAEVTYEVTLSDGTRWRAKLVGAEPDKDLAVLHIDAPADKLRPIAVGTSADLQVGQKVFAIGNPFGLDHSLTTGIISGLDRETKSPSNRPIQGVIQTDAAINPGNSGGPLLDSGGRLIGINTAIYSPSGAYAGVGFAVPVDTINRVVPELIANGRVVRPGLGIDPVPDRVAKANRVEGVIIKAAPPGSAAAAAGLVGVSVTEDGRGQLGDVIVAADGTPVRELDDLYRVFDGKKVGDTVELEVTRGGGEKRKVKVTLQALPGSR